MTALGSFDYFAWSVGLSEGGLANHPADHGGLTNYGITQPFADAYARATGAAPVPVRRWTPAMARDAYRVLIWEGPWVRARAVSALAPQTGFVYADGCVNHGSAQAARLLQREVGVIPDGLVGPGTLDALLSAVGHRGDSGVAIGLLNRRRDLYELILERDPSQAAFRWGWMARMNDVAHRAALAWKWKPEPGGSHGAA